MMQDGISISNSLRATWVCRDSISQADTGLAPMEWFSYETDALKVPTELFYSSDYSGACTRKPSLHPYIDFSSVYRKRANYTSKHVVEGTLTVLFNQNILISTHKRKYAPTI